MLSAALICLVAAAAEAPNLIHNGGFEDIVGGGPAVWQKFVQPMEGAEAVRDVTVAYEGAASVRIVNPQPYEREPANNWSQNVVRDLAGKDLVLRGWIRTENATHAALWVQCCRKVPFTTLRFRSTYDEMPVYGTEDWTQVEVRVTAPEGTDFITVRCVLQGEGAAWFDAIELYDAAALEPPPPPVTEDETNAETDLEETPPAEEAETEPAPAPTPESPQPDPAEALAEANRELQAMLDAVRQSNAFLADQLAAQNEEIQALREEIDALRNEIEATETEPVVVEPIVIPPLVPGRIAGANTP